MRDEILGQLKAALPVDGVMLGLHGAMVADGYDDCEGDLLERVRALVGPKVPIGVEYDPHSHLTKKRIANADVIICFKEFPHTDFVERAEELVDIVIRAVKGEVKPVMSRLRLPHDRQLPDHDPADARLRRQDQGAGRQERHPVDLRRALLPLCRRAGARRQDHRRHRQPQGRRRPARNRARPRVRRHARQDPAHLPHASTAPSTRRSGQTKAP